MSTDLSPLEEYNVGKLTKEIRAVAAGMGRQEARLLVDSYYQLQEGRKAASNQVSACDRDVDQAPIAVLEWLVRNQLGLERGIATMMQAYAAGDPVGRWSLSICGIGPIIAAGLLAHIEIEKAPTAGHIWRFAGLDPTVEWGKGEKRPWNAQLKVLCWKIGESFVKVSNNENDYYGHLYIERKALELERNEAGQFADQAASALERKSFRKDTVAKAAYEQGKLPPGHLHARAKRWAVKLFLSHWQAVAYACAYGVAPPRPYVVTHLGHAHVLLPPNMPEVIYTILEPAYLKAA